MRSILGRPNVIHETGWLSNVPCSVLRLLRLGIGQFSIRKAYLSLKAQGWHAGTIRVILHNPVYKRHPISGKQQTVTNEARLGQPNALTGRPLTTMVTRWQAAEENGIALSAPTLVSEAMWDAVQQRFGVMDARYGGSPKQTRMLSGLTACPFCFCGGPAVTRYQTTHGKPYRYYVCSASR